MHYGKISNFKEERELIFSEYFPYSQPLCKRVPFSLYHCHKTKLVLAELVAPEFLRWKEYYLLNKVI